MYNSMVYHTVALNGFLMHEVFLVDPDIKQLESFSQTF